MQKLNLMKKERQRKMKEIKDKDLLWQSQLEEQKRK